MKLPLWLSAYAGLIALVLSSHLACNAASGQSTAQPVGDDPVETEVKDAAEGRRWPTPIPNDCPFPRSTHLSGIRLTGRHAHYTVTDYYDTSWAADGNLYAKCGDGALESAALNILNAGIVKIIGDDPLSLQFRYLGDFNSCPDVTNWQSGANTRRYGCATLVRNGVWYYGLEDGWNTSSDTGIGRFWGFLYSRDFDRVVGSLGEVADHSFWRLKENPYWHDPTGQEARYYPRTTRIGEYPLYPDGVIPPRAGGFFGEPPNVNRIRNPHFVDLGRDCEWATDNYVYMTCHGSEGLKPPEWANGDSVYLLRCPARFEDIIRADGWEFYAGKSQQREDLWSHAVIDARPLLTWTDRLGHAYVVYNKPLGRYIMCISPLVVKDNESDSPHKLYSAEGCLLLESEQITGPWSIFQYLGGFGPNAYAMSMPSKFISPDGRRAWLLYSAGWGAEGLPADPPGSTYAACFQEILIDTLGK
ncbi:MAG: hypothetical protein HPY44_19690 [Armatimonadetes bacterium]|nr:hypothetical protein [Armatimonadota bacterium]